MKTSYMVKVINNYYLQLTNIVYRCQIFLLSTLKPKLVKHIYNGTIHAN